MDPQVKRLIEMLKTIQVEGAPRRWELPPEVARRAADTMLASTFNEGGPTMAETLAIEVPGRRGAIPARLYVPEGVSDASPGLLDLHGGGWVIGSPDTHDRLTRELAAVSVPGSSRSPMGSLPSGRTPRGSATAWTPPAGWARRAPGSVSTRAASSSAAAPLAPTSRRPPC